MGRLLKEVDQGELCHWMAFFKLEREEYNRKKDDAPDKDSSKPKTESTQVQQDNLLFQQLMMLAAGRGREERQKNQI